jgi:hypothetical protein
MRFMTGIMATLCFLFCGACKINLIIKDSSQSDILSHQYTDVQYINETIDTEVTVHVPRHRKATTPLPPRQIKKKSPRKRYERRYKRVITKSPPTKRDRPPKRARQKNTTFKKQKKNNKRTENALPREKKKR